MDDTQKIISQIDTIGDYVASEWDVINAINEKIASFSRGSVGISGVLKKSINDINNTLANDVVGELRNIDTSIWGVNQTLLSIDGKIDQFLGNGNNNNNNNNNNSSNSNNTPNSFEIDVFMDKFGNKALSLLKEISANESMGAGLTREDYLDRKGLTEVEYNGANLRVNLGQLNVARAEGKEDELLKAIYDLLKDKNENEPLNAEDAKKRTRDRKIRRSKPYKAAKTTLKVVGDIGGAAIGGIKDPKSMTASKATTAIGGAAAGALSALGPWGAIAGEIVKGITSAVSMVFDLLDEVQKPAQEYARTIGGGAKAYKSMQASATEIAKKNSDWGDTLFEAKDYMESITKFQGEYGRLTEKSAKSWDSITTLMKVFNMDAKNLAELADYGLNGERMEEFMLSAYKTAAKTGVAYSKMGESLKTNIKLASKYSFKEGLDDLTKMAQRSASIKMNMQDVMKFGDKVSTVEGAVETAANLSVLGSDFARFSDPMQMLNESLTDRGALSKRIEGMLEGKAMWNKEKQTVDINPYDRERIRAAAKAMGMSDDSFYDILQRMGTGKEISSQVTSSKIKGNEELMEYIRNTASIGKDGVARIMVGNEEKAVSQLGEGDINALNKERTVTEDSMRSIAVATMTTSDHVRGIFLMMKNVIVKAISRVFGYDESKALVDESETEEERKKMERLRAEADRNIDKSWKGRGWGATGGVLTGAASGAAIGAAFGGVGALPGAIVGGIIGGIGGGLVGDQYDTSVNGERRAEYMQNQMNKGYSSAGGADDIKDNGQNIDGKRGMMSILHPHETVLPANLAEDMRTTFSIMRQSTKTDVFPTNNNTLRSVKVNRGISGDTFGTQNISTKIELAPLKIDGTIKLDLGNNTVNIDANKLLNNSLFIDNLSKIIVNKVKDINNYGKNNNVHIGHWNS